MAKIRNIATVQLLLDEEDSTRTIDGISEMLSHNEWVLDWSYLRIGGQQLDPTIVVIRDDYEEGEAFI